MPSRYGWRHQKLREQLIRAWLPGQPCVRCGLPTHDPRKLDLGHTVDGTSYVGLEHRGCNRAEGGRRGAAKTNAMKAARTRSTDRAASRRSSRRW